MEIKHFLHADEHQSFYKLALLFFMEVTRHVQSTQSRKLVTLLQYMKKKLVKLLFCSVVMQNVQIFYGGLVMSIATRCYMFVVGWLQSKIGTQPFRS